MRKIDLSEVAYVGNGLKRPECVYATKSGMIYTSHADPNGQGGIACIYPNGQIETILAEKGDVPEIFITNGYALMPDGSFMIANLGPDGGVYRLTRDGTLTLELDAVDGRKLPSTNFVNRDAQGRLWVSVSTWHDPRDQAFRRGVCDGFIVLMDENGGRIVADDVDFANENKVHPSGKWLYVNETMGRAVVRYAIKHDGGLGPKEIAAEYGEGNFPDGFEFDCEGGIWMTSIVSNRVVHVSPEGWETIILEAGDQGLIARSEVAYQNGDFNRDYQNEGNASPLGNCASICFGGPDLKSVFLGSLAGHSVSTFRVDVSGAEPAHWHF